MTEYTSDVGFTPAVKEIQSRKGSRSGYEEMEKKGGWRTRVDDVLSGFLAGQRSVFLASVSSEGAPYIQHRGGPPGFVKVIDDKTLGFVDYRGNRQYITQGNLAGNNKVHLFLMDYMNRRRIKIWGKARIVEGDEKLLEELMPEGYKARPEQVVLIELIAWDINCPQHIPQRFEADDVARALKERDDEIERLNARIEELSAKE